MTDLPKTDRIKRYVLELEDIAKHKLSDEIIIESTELREYYLLRQRELIDFIKDFIDLSLIHI